jgi:hypothetical protein
VCNFDRFKRAHKPVHDNSCVHPEKLTEIAAKVVCKNLARRARRFLVSHLIHANIRTYSARSSKRTTWVNAWTPVAADLLQSVHEERRGNIWCSRCHSTTLNTRKVIQAFHILWVNKKENDLSLKEASQMLWRIVSLDEVWDWFLLEETTPDFNSKGIFAFEWFDPVSNSVWNLQLGMKTIIFVKDTT